MESSSNCATARIHVAKRLLSIEEAGLFIASSILLSHGIRPCTIAVVRLHRTWIIAPSWSIRQFRPDEDSRTGWIKAVLRGKKLGAMLTPIEATIEEALNSIGVRPQREQLCIAEEKPPTLRALEAAAKAALEGKQIIYATKRECSKAPTLGAPAPIAPAIVNIAADRLQAGLSPAPGFPRGKAPLQGRRLVPREGDEEKGSLLKRGM